MTTRPRKHKLPSIHPGRILRDEFLLPLTLSQYRLAREINVPGKRIGEIIKGKRAITADTALRLSRRFGTSSQFWMNLQTRFDLETAEDAIGHRLDKEVRVRAA
jgi:addiction module HigA family antidote